MRSFSSLFLRFVLPSELYIGIPFQTTVTIVDDDDGNWINSTSE